MLSWPDLTRRVDMRYWRTAVYLCIGLAVAMGVQSASHGQTTAAGTKAATADAGGKIMRGKVLFSESFTNLDEWHKEGLVEGVTVPQPGVLRLDCTGSKQGAVGAMAFCRRDFPDNIVIEYDLLVENHNGLLITFMAMQGVNGEDAITGVPERKGVFADYVDGEASARSYHVSICRYDDEGKHTGTSNWRRNPGLHLMTEGLDLCRETGKTYHVVITKQGPACQVQVNGELGSHVVDPQRLPGPIPMSGKVGFRAIGSKAVFQIRNFKVSELATGQH
jgi:hypothetical protein